MDSLRFLACALLFTLLSVAHGGAIVPLSCPDGSGVSPRDGVTCLPCLPGSSSNGSHCIDECVPFGDFTSTVLYVDEDNDKHCFGYHATAANWDTARTSCQNDFGGHLATFASAEEEDAVNATFGALNNLAWIGASDKFDNTVFVWENGEYFGRYENWGSTPEFGQEPNNHGGSEECVEKVADGRWNDRECSFSHPYYCEVTQSLLSRCENVPASGATSKWEDAAGNWHCYWSLSFGSEQEYSTVQSLCSAGATGGHFATLTERQEHQHMYFMGMTTGWSFDLTDSTTEGNFQPGSTAEAQAFYNWDSNEPNDSSGEDCVDVRASRRWNDVKCNRIPGAVCEYEESLIPACPGRVRADDVDGLYHCYEYVQPNADFATAEADCVSLGGHLASLNSENEKNAVHNIVTDNPVAYWIGLDNRNRIEPDDFIWTSGETVGYENWNGGEPNNSGGSEDCGTALRPNWTWNDFPCADTYPYVCEGVVA